VASTESDPERAEETY